MMKIFFCQIGSLLFALLLLGYSAGSQPETINRLENKLKTSSADSSKAITLDSLSMDYLFFSNKSDSTFYYANQFINYAFSLPDKKYLILAYARMGFYYINTAQYKDALDISLKGISVSETNHIPDYLPTLYYNLVWVYYNLGDYREALINAFIGISFLKYSKDRFYDQALHINGIIGNLYQDSGKPDSAFYYYRKVDSIASSSKELAAKDISAYYWSLYYLYFERDYAKADSIILIGIANCKKNGDFLLDDFLIWYSNSYLSQGKTGKAITEARQAYMLSLPINDPEGGSYAAGLLNACYEALGNRDSAYRYLKIEDSLQKVIQKNSNANEIQQIRFDKELGQKEQEAALTLQIQKNRAKITMYVSLTALIFMLVIAGIQWRNNRHRKKANALLQKQKEKVESTLSELKSTQAQLVQSEKMASLGELTAGIAHEIQNPLNFVNNFSEVNKELLVEMKDEIKKGNMNEVNAIADDVISNEEKIIHHGKRADAIVKGMLQHSRSSTGKKEPTNINALADEYLRLSYHGLRAKDKEFNATMNTDFDQTIGKINIIPQDIGRVLLNLYNNAFYAVTEKKKQQPEGYEPTVSICTKKINDKVEIRVKDNGNGIPQKVVDKIFQPFFTTKPTGQGTGLGLSLSYDIIKAHGGEIKVETNEGKGSEFIMQLPI
jgi:two-component system NtrC family sensor kinase